MKHPRLTHPGRAGGFTLVELLMVLGIISLLSVLALPMIGSLNRANNLNSATATIASVLEQARAEAMANNTYVFVGFEETNFSTPSTQTQTAGTGSTGTGGRVAVQIFSSLDGTLNLAASNLAPLSRMQILNNLNLPPSVVATGNLARPTATYVVGNTSFPTGSAIVSGNFTFTKIMAFDPQGVIHLPSSPGSLQYLEIDVQESNGSNVPAAAPNQSSIQVDGLTGAVTIYRS